jgi:hypothetical protein
LTQERQERYDMGVKISARSMIGSTGLPKVAGFLFGGDKLSG